ncbi:hypothetical protein [Moorena bouillonii]|uniref:Uncharacterized protein n=1 Tax=Moorena bouillonii PNG TaxID=568701 RepID=A0A1U7MXN5_9CYAN|nr:hypothetical protein [Moorena bouillonii]OLT58463.1 hypothetical protein BJP37_04800 [Moorena bouillonii PNG]
MKLSDLKDFDVQSLEHKSEEEMSKKTLIQQNNGAENTAPTWTEESLAELLKFDTSYDQEQNPSTQGVIPSTDGTADLDPDLNVTQQEFAKSGWAKGASVGAVTGSIAVVAGLVFTGMTSLSSKKKLVEKVTPIPTSVEKESENATDSEIGRLKTELALAKQQKQIQAIQDKKRPKTTIELAKSEEPPSPSPKTPPPPRPRPAVRSAPPPPVVRASTRPAPRPVRQPVVIRQAPRPRPVQQPVVIRQAPPPRPVRTAPVRTAPTPPPVAKAPTPPPPPPAPAAKIDPMEQWLALSQLGSYGLSSANTPEAPEQNVAMMEPSPQTQPVAQRNNGIRGRSTIANTYSIPAVQRVSNSPNPPQPLNGSPVIFADQVAISEEASILAGRAIRRKLFSFGQEAAGELVTPIVWTKSNLSRNSQQPNLDERFVVSLSEPLVDEDNQVLLKAGSKIVFRCDMVDDSGLVNSDAIGLIIDDQEYQLPPGVISLRGDKGNPMVANVWDRGSDDIARNDMIAFLFGSAAKVGEVLNQPERSQIITSSGFGSSQSSTFTSRDRNLWGAVLEGGFKPLAQDIVERNASATRRLQNLPKLWYMGAGSSVQIFVNTPFEL